MPENKKLTEELAGSLQNATSLLESLLDQIKCHTTGLAILTEKVSTLTKTVDDLNKIVSKGNGKESVLTRLALIEAQMEDIEEDVKGHILISKEEHLVDQKMLSALETEIQDHIKLSQEKQLQLQNEEKALKGRGKIELIKMISVGLPGLASVIYLILDKLLG